MRSLHALLNAGNTATPAQQADATKAALACLDRFTVAFNACNLEAMDAELHFPHVMLAENVQHIWARPGQHPSDLFSALQAQGWSRTQYESREVILASEHKVHCIVTYTRRRVDGSVLSEHTNLWVVTQVQGRWGIAWRSY